MPSPIHVSRPTSTSRARSAIWEAQQIIVFVFLGPCRYNTTDPLTPALSATHLGQPRSTPLATWQQRACKSSRVYTALSCDSPPPTPLPPSRATSMAATVAAAAAEAMPAVTAAPTANVAGHPLLGPRGLFEIKTPDTRELALLWLGEHGITGDVTYMFVNSEIADAYNDTTDAALRRMQEMVGRTAAEVETEPDGPGSAPPPSPQARPAKPPSKRRRVAGPKKERRRRVRDFNLSGSVSTIFLAVLRHFSAHSNERAFFA